MRSTTWFSSTWFEQQFFETGIVNPSEARTIFGAVTELFACYRIDTDRVRIDARA